MKNKIKATAQSKSESTTNAAVEAIKFAISTDEGMEFLRAWLHGDFDVIRMEWPECPKSVFAGAESVLMP